MTTRLIERTPSAVRPAVDLIAGTIDDTFRDRVPGLAAEIAFFTLLSLPPLLLTVLAGVGLVGDLVNRPEWPTDLVLEIESVARLILSADGMETFSRLLDRLVESRGSLVSLGAIVTIITASRAFRVVSVAITIAYDLEATRPRWQHRIWGLALTAGGIVVAIAIGPLLIAGPEGGRTLSNLAGGIPGLAELWLVLYWPAAAALLTTLVAVLYHVAAPWKTPFHRDLPGALVAMLLWLAGSAALRVYVGQAIDDSYGFIATPLVILLWLYVSAFALLLGAELNAEIEERWPTAQRTDPEAAAPRSAPSTRPHPHANV